jgi:hypothetical protein
MMLQAQVMTNRVIIGLMMVLQTLQMSELKASEDTKPRKPLRLINPATEIVVQQNAGRVRFEFYIRDDSDPPKRVLNDKVSTFVVRNFLSEELWKIEAARGDKTASTVTYGVVPPGFVQTVPKHGGAPRLDNNVEYYVSADGWYRGSASFVYQSSRKDRNKPVEWDSTKQRNGRR